jgi:hypothetical protein
VCVCVIFQIIQYFHCLYLSVLCTNLSKVCYMYPFLSLCFLTSMKWVWLLHLHSCHDILCHNRPKATGPSDHGLKPWAKINLCSIKLIYLRYFVTVMKSWLIQGEVCLSGRTPAKMIPIHIPAQSHSFFLIRKLQSLDRKMRWVLWRQSIYIFSLSMKLFVLTVYMCLCPYYEMFLPSLGIPENNKKGYFWKRE